MKKKLTRTSGAPVADNQNVMTAGKRGHQLLFSCDFQRWQGSAARPMPSAIK